MRGIVLQDWGTYEDQTLVCVGGMTDKEILAYLKRANAKASFIEAFKTRDSAEDADGWIFNAETGGTVIWMKSGKLNWDFYETLIHEIHHAVHFLGRRRAMADEHEALAYQMEFLFREIRRKLQKLAKKCR